MTANTYSIRENEDQGCRFRRINKKGLRAALDVTGRCNLHCKHCFACSQHTELSTAQLLRIIREMPEIQVTKIILTGGEPLLRSDLEVLIGAATDLSIGVDINTNLSPFTPKRARGLWEAGLREISTSLDGMNTYHDWFRQSAGDFDRVIKGIRLATSMGYTVDVHGVCTPDNVQDIAQLIDTCAELGISSYTLLAVVALGKGIAQLRDQHFTLGDSDKTILSEVLTQKRSQYGSTLAIRTVDIFNHPHCSECPMAEQVIGITPSGQLLPCLLADYSPRPEENLTTHALSETLTAVRTRIGLEGKRLGCSNVAYAQTQE